MPGRRHFSALLAALCLVGASAHAKPLPAPATILVVGDSLSAEYGLKRGSGWVALLDQRLAQQKIPAKVVNASISGDTTSGGLSRLPALLKEHHPSLVILELGGNDALRGLPLAMSQKNLEDMARQSRAAGAKVLIVGMEVPPNYGPQYTREFAAMFGKVAKSQGAPLVPFLLKGIADDPDPLRWFQADRIHPNEQAQATMLANVWPELRKQLK